MVDLLCLPLECCNYTEGTIPVWVLVGSGDPNPGPHTCAIFAAPAHVPLIKQMPFWKQALLWGPCLWSEAAWLLFVNPWSEGGVFCCQCPPTPQLCWDCLIPLSPQPPGGKQDLKALNTELTQGWPHDLMITDHPEGRGPGVARVEGTDLVTGRPMCSSNPPTNPHVTQANDLLSKSLSFLIYKMSKCPCLSAGLNTVSKKNVVAQPHAWYWNGNWLHVGFAKAQCPLCPELVDPALGVSLSALLESSGCCLCTREASSSWILASVPLQWLRWSLGLVTEPLGTGTQ